MEETIIIWYGHFWGVGLVGPFATEDELYSAVSGGSITLEWTESVEVSRRFAKALL